MMMLILSAVLAWSMSEAGLAPGGVAPALAAEPAAEGDGPGGNARVNPQVARAVDALVEQLRLHPARPAQGTGRVGVLLMDAHEGGGVPTLVAEEIDDQLIRCGSPAWSPDGKRILFDATTGNKTYALSRILGVELSDGRLARLDLGKGVSPIYSPSGDRVMFYLNPGAEVGQEAGLRIMNADGTRRAPLGGFGRARWSTDGHQFLVVSFSDPADVTVIDDRPGRKNGQLQVADLKVFGVPEWAEEGTILAVVGDEEADRIALIDVTDPEHGTVKEVLWARGKGVDVTPSELAYSPVTRSCVFTGKQEGKGFALYRLNRGELLPPTRLEREGFDSILANPAFSPDGRYLLLRSDRTERRKTGDRR